MARDKLKVGIVGCGEATQILHLPSLYYLSDQIELAALCDVSEEVLAYLGARTIVDKRYLYYRDLLEQADVNAILVATPHAYHSEVVLAAIEAGKHVLVEKPLCMTLREADAIIAAQRKAGVIVQVGYMRRYADAFLRACDMVRAMPEIKLARVHDVIGQNSLFIEHSSKVVRGNDVPERLWFEAERRQTELLEEVIETKDPALQRTYLLLLSLSSHDISAMRELLGKPKGVLYAAQRHEGMYITAAFDYGDFICHFETGINKIADFDAYLKVYGSERIVQVKYDTPYVRNLPIKLLVTEAMPDGSIAKQTVHPGWSDPFVAEWRAFLRAIETKATPKTSPEDFREDLLIFGSMLSQIKRRRRSGAVFGAES